MIPKMCFELVIMYQSLVSSDHHALSFGRVPLLTCIWMSGASGLGNQTTLTMLVELASFCSCIDFNVTDPLSSFEMNISSKYINTNIHRCIAKDCLLTLVKSRLALGSPGCLVGCSFVHLSPCQKWPNTQENGY